eukprot:EG_transcript_20658
MGGPLSCRPIRLVLLLALCAVASDAAAARLTVVRRGAWGDPLALTERLKLPRPLGMGATPPPPERAPPRLRAHRPPRLSGWAAGGGGGALLAGCAAVGFLCWQAWAALSPPRRRAAVFATAGDRFQEYQEYANMKVDALKARLRELGEPVGGRKEELIARLQEAEAANQRYWGMKVGELKERLRALGEQVGGRKEDLIARLREAERSRQPPRPRPPQTTTPPAKPSLQSFVVDLQAEGVPIAIEKLRALLHALESGRAAAAKRPRGRPRQTPAAPDAFGAGLPPEFRQRLLSSAALQEVGPPGPAPAAPLTAAD